MGPNMRSAILIIAIFSLVGCTSLTEKGNELYASGMYNEAAAYYEKALARDSANVDARIGLEKARNKIIDRGLIDVRMLRLSSNAAGAADKLEEILRNQQEWNLTLSGAIASTQAEETRHARYWLIEQARDLSQSAYPDKFRWLAVSHRELIRATQLRSKMESLQKVVEEKGRKTCREMARDVDGQRFFLRDFVQKYCTSWGVEIDLKVDSMDKSRYRGLDITPQVTYWTNFGSTQHNNLEFQLNELKQKFRDSIWYSSIGDQALSVRANGNVNYNRNSSAQYREASYTIDSVRTVVNNGVKEEKTVEIKKKHPYYANVISENFSFDIWYSTKILGETLSKVKKFSKSAVTESHNENFPAAGLQPKRPSLMNVSALLSDKLGELNDEYLGVLRDKWAAAYCENHGSDALAENVLRCGKVRPDAIHVNSWARQKFGVSYEELMSLYGI